jgi:hypothetical protein
MYAKTKPHKTQRGKREAAERLTREGEGAFTGLKA